MGFSVLRLDLLEDSEDFWRNTKEHTSYRHIKLVIEIALFLTASYFVFYKAWLKELAKVATIKSINNSFML